MKTVLRTLFASVLAVVLLAMFTATGCKKEEGTLEKLGKQADKKVEQSKESLKEAKEDLEK